LIRVSDKVITILVGNIGSGKSTWIKNRRGPQELVLCRDALRYMFGGGEYLFDPENVEPEVKTCTNAIMEILCADGKNIIIDETNVSKEMRQKYIKTGKQYGYKMVAVEFPKLSKEESVDRRMTNPHGQPDRDIWNMVWQMFDDAYEKPTLEEGFDLVMKGRNDTSDS